VSFDIYTPDTDLDLSQYTYAITPDMTNALPTSSLQTINLGHRILSPATIFLILKQFDLNPDYLDDLYTYYGSMRNDASVKSLDKLAKAKNAVVLQSLALDQIHEIVLSVRQDGSINLVNKAARDAFYNEDLGISQELQNTLEKLCDPQSYERLDQSEHKEDIVTIDGKQYLVKMTRTQSFNKRVFLFSLLPTSNENVLKETRNNRQNSGGFVAKHTFEDYWGSNQKTKILLKRANAFAATDKTVLILGESGTGKELLAQSIHNASSRAKQPFVGINLSAIPSGLLSSELFGYEEGAYTGAKKGGKKGFFELAEHGTIFLDEIGDAPMEFQVALLRVLEEKTITKIGGSTNLPIDVRIIAATNKPLKDLIKTGEFRADLYYRLQVLSLQTIPVRESSDEIIDLIDMYSLKLFNQKFRFTDEALNLLTIVPWPGNHRELKNVVEFLHYTTSPDEIISPEYLPDYLMREYQSQIARDFNNVYLSEPLDELSINVLHILYDNSPACIGRGVILQKLSQNGIASSDAVVRRVLNSLKDMGLISAGNTRQGSHITEKGMIYLNKEGIV
jgi:transcriptional regulator with PAS, ATPase and Fis domain